VSSFAVEWGVFSVREDNQLENLLVRIIDIHAATLQEFLDSLASALAGYDIVSASLFSTTLLHQGQLELVASTADEIPHTVSFENERASATVFLDIDQSFFLSIRGRQPIPVHTVIRKAIANKVQEVIYHKRQAVRRCVIEQSIKSKDVNSFLHRVLRALKAEFVYAEDISIFLYEQSAKRIYLSASTSPIRGIDKKDIYYQTTDHCPTVVTFKSNSQLVEDDITHIVKEEFDHNMYAAKLYNRGYWPISLAWANLHSINAEGISALGVVKISNLQRRRASATWRGSFSRYDHLIISFISEVLFVLVQQYFQFTSAETNFARLAHGLGANIDASLKFAANLREELFENAEEDSTPRARFALRRADLYKTEDIFLTLKNLEFFLEDLSYQFGRFDVGNLSSYERERIEKPYAEVLMPAIRLIPAIAAVNSKQPATVSNLKTRGAPKLPPIIGSRIGLILVLRNLFENSIKYTKHEVANIDFTFTEEEQNIVMDYYDQGIGIAAHELEEIFVEGYRSMQARRTSNRGIGVGLSSARDMMRHLNGDLKCLYHVGGAHFQLTMRKAI
jgi:hypothetical protein